jgi:hypothetical protein
MKPPSCEGAGGGGVGCDSEPPNQPMMIVLEGVRIGVFVGIPGVASVGEGRIGLLAGVEMDVSQDGSNSR